MAVSLHPLWNSGIPGTMGILGRDVTMSLHPLRNSGILGMIGILGRDVPVSLHPWNSGIPGIVRIMGRDVISQGPLEFRELCEFWGEMSYHWSLWNSGILGILGRDVISLEMTNLISSVDPRPSPNSQNSAK